LNKKEIKANEKNFARRRRALFSFTSFFSLCLKWSCPPIAINKMCRAPFFSSLVFSAPLALPAICIAMNFIVEIFAVCDVEFLLLIMQRQTGADLMDSRVKRQRLHQRSSPFLSSTTAGSL
jgi:hypothetical protein